MDVYSLGMEIPCMGTGEVIRSSGIWRDGSQVRMDMLRILRGMLFQSFASRLGHAKCIGTEPFRHQLVVRVQDIRKCILTLEDAVEVSIQTPKSQRCLSTTQQHQL